jgi:hypothetical protein
MSHAVAETPTASSHSSPPDYEALRQSREALNLIFLSDCGHPPLTHEPISVI